MVRIASNYARMIGTCLLGLWLVRLLLGFGAEAYAVIVLIGAGHGIAAMVKDMARVSVIPHLSAAWHKESRESFGPTYNAAIVVCAAASLLTLGGSLVFILGLRWMAVPPHLINAATIFCLAKTAQTICEVSLAPAVNMYVICNRMIAYNAWMLADRVVETLAVIVILYVWPPASDAAAICTYGVVSSAASALLTVTSAAAISLSERRLVIAPFLATRNDVLAMVRSAIASSSIILAANMYFRLDAMIVNLYDGLIGNMIFGIATQLVSYIRSFGLGLIIGLDALAARVISNEGLPGMRRLVQGCSRLQGAVAFPMTLFILFQAPAIAEAWIGTRLADPGGTLASIVTLIRILAIGLAGRSLGEAWIQILNGSGRHHRTAACVVTVAIMNPVLVLAMYQVVPAAYKFTSSAWMYSILSIVLYTGIVPLLLRLELKVPLRETLGSLTRPLITAIGCVPLLIVPLPVPPGSIAEILMRGGVYVAAFAVLATVVILTDEEKLLCRSQLARVTHSWLKLPGPAADPSAGDRSAQAALLATENTRCDVRRAS